MKPAPIKGRVTGGFYNAAGERVWLIVWTPNDAGPVYVKAELDLHEGQAVRLLDGQLQAAS